MIVGILYGVLFKCIIMIVLVWLLMVCLMVFGDMIWDDNLMLVNIGEVLMRDIVEVVVMKFLLGIMILLLGLIFNLCNVSFSVMELLVIVILYGCLNWCEILFLNVCIKLFVYWLILLDCKMFIIVLILFWL